jgi:phosphoesterase RecJ-like protein
MLRSLRGVRVGLLFHELADGALRLNLRSDGSINVGKLAAEWGGGGHPAAAGLHLPEAEYESTRDGILTRCAEAVGDAAGAKGIEGPKGGKGL